MNKTQKSALYGVLLSLLLAGLVAFDFVETRVGLPTKVLMAIIWGGLLLVPVYLLARKGQTPEPDMDERDKQIINRALLASCTLLAGILGVAFVVAFLVLGLRKTISATMDDISAVVYFVLIGFLLVVSVSVLVQYRPARVDRENPDSPGSKTESPLLKGHVQ